MAPVFDGCWFQRTTWDNINIVTENSPEEVERTFEQYYRRMEEVVSSFEVIAG